MELIANPENGAKIDARDTMYPSLLEVVSGDWSGDAGMPMTTYGFAINGNVRVSFPGGSFDLEEGGYFCVPSPCRVRAEGRAALIHRYGYRGQVSAGRIEKKGRLTYIDGCSDSMLVYPPRMGDPVLNHLHFPPGIRQTQHTHPSIRMGIVARGSGISFGPKRLGRTGDGDMWEHNLVQGCVFLLHEQEMHSFRTTESDEPMDVIAYHPDSDTGPTDQNHPMINRTYLGASAFQHITPVR